MALASAIEDPIVRGAGVTRWIAERADQLDPQRGRALCLTLDGPDRGRCQRRLSSAHLRR